MNMDEDIWTDSTLYVCFTSAKQWLIPLIRKCNDKMFVPDIYPPTHTHTPWQLFSIKGLVWWHHMSLPAQDPKKAELPRRYPLLMLVGKTIDLASSGSTGGWQKLVWQKAREELIFERRHPFGSILQNCIEMWRLVFLVTTVYLLSLSPYEIDEVTLRVDLHIRRGNCYK